MISVPTVYRRIINQPDTDLLETVFGERRMVVMANT
jgi:hypothetical protein